MHFALFDLPDIVKAQASAYAILVHVSLCHMAVNDQSKMLYMTLRFLLGEAALHWRRIHIIEILQLNLIAPKLPSSL